MIDTPWTVYRALQYYRTLPSRTPDIARAAVAGDGFVSGAALRTGGSSLRGYGGALKRILEPGVRAGW